MLTRTITASALLAALSLVSAQTSTTCSPLTNTCPADPGLAQSSVSTDFTAGASSDWTVLSGASLSYSSNGAEFTITGDGQSPTMQFNKYIFGGRVDVTMQAAPGAGIVSSIVLISDDLDEIDFEVIGSDTTQIQTNFFGKGDTSTYSRGGFSAVTTPASTFHTYSIIYTQEQIQWLIDGAVVRTVPYASPLANGGAEFPQTPMQVRIGSWVAGGANNAPGTVQWAGGKVNWSAAPFNMFVKSVSITNYNPASSYSYGDHTGSWGSIQVSGAVAGSSPAASSASAVTSTTSTTSTSSTTTIVSTSSTPVVVKVQSSVLSSSSSSTTSIATTSTSTSSTPTSTITTIVTSAASTGFVSQSRTSSATPTSSSPALSTGGAASLGVSAAGSLLGLAAAFMML